MPTIGPQFCRLCGREANNPQGFNGKYQICRKCYGLQKRKRVSVICQYCGKEYELREKEAESRKRFCSIECYHNSTRGKQAGQKIRKTCPQCLIEFEVSKGQSKRIYCSKQCAYNARRIEKPFCIDCHKKLKRFRTKRCPSCAAKKKRLNEIIAKGKTPKTIFTNCIQCGKLSNTKRGFYNGLCSPCAMIISSKKRIKQITITCPMCHREFSKEKNIIEKNERTFCSKKCYNKWLSENIIGNKVPNWRGGGKKYYGPNWKYQSKLCRKIANYRCENCGKSQKDNKYALDVHHKIPFRTFGYIPDKNDNYLLANNLSNLMALCRTCHRKLEARKNEIL